MKSDIRLRSLNSVIIRWTAFCKEHKLDKRYPEQMFQRFIALNRSGFDFLGISYEIVTDHFEYGLKLSASNFIGAIPIFSPAGGKPMADLIVEPNYHTEINEIISLLGQRINVEFASMKLCNPVKFRLPVYYECLEYMQTFNEAISENWTKFGVINHISSIPSSSTDWQAYAINQATNINAVNEFNNKLNVHSTDHLEWNILTRMLYEVMNKYRQSGPPAAVIARNHSLENRLNKYLSSRGEIPYYPLNKRDLIQLSDNAILDPPLISQLKALARRIISSNPDNNRAWRIDVATLFERFVQLVAAEAARRKKWQNINNPHYLINTRHRPSWMLSYLEPDLILLKGERCLTIDAKYKSHIFNSDVTNSSILKDTFRNDFHQLLAYSSLVGGRIKHSILVYPATKFKEIEVEVSSPFSDVRNHISLISIPFSAKEFSSTVERFVNLLS